ncbi:MAG: ABC transporter ATP-binding protein, partial [Acidobacteriota bacterium]
TMSLDSQAVGLLGPNGAGKTTLLNTLLGFNPPTSGTARVLGYDIRRDSGTMKSLIGYMPENDSFVSGITAVRFVSMMAELSGLPREVALEKAHEALFWTGLGEARYRKIETFSQGMKQLVKLAQAIVHGPRILFLDEPTNGLDPPARQRMLTLINDIVHKNSTRLLLSSHLLRDVEECCQDVLILNQGEIAGCHNLEEEKESKFKFLEMDLQGDRNQFVAEIERRGCTSAEYADGRLKIVLPESLSSAEIFFIALDMNIQVRKMEMKRSTLEDIFLQAVEKRHGSVQ